MDDGLSDIMFSILNAIRSSEAGTIRGNPKKLGNTEGDGFIAIMAEIWNAPYALFCKIQGSM